jgi:hypothetical protein
MPKKPRLSKKVQRGLRKLLKPLLRVPREEPLCGVPRPRDRIVEVVVDVAQAVRRKLG